MGDNHRYTVREVHEVRLCSSSRRPETTPTAPRRPCRMKSARHSRRWGPSWSRRVRRGVRLGRNRGSRKNDSGPTRAPPARVVESVRDGELLRRTRSSVVPTRAWVPPQGGRGVVLAPSLEDVPQARNPSVAVEGVAGGPDRVVRP